MSERSPTDLRFDVDRYRKLLAEATDEKKRLALIKLLIEEQAVREMGAERFAEPGAATVAEVPDASKD
jgi:hypothetical protein